MKQAQYLWQPFTHLLAIFSVNIRAESPHLTYNTLYLLQNQSANAI
jgi:hypothetical protein